MPPKKLLIFDTHPIQYRSPVFKQLAKMIPEFKVFYFSEGFEGKQWWLHEKAAAKSQNWQVPLTEGFSSQVIPGTFLKLRKILKEEQPAAILFYGYFLPQHWVLWALAFLYRIPILFIGETQLRKSSFLRQKIKQILLPLFFKGVSQIITIGNQSKQFYKSLRIPDSKITEAKYCVDNAFFTGGPRKSKSDLFTLLFVGRLFDRKRPRDIITLMESLKNFPVRMRVAGSGPLEKELRIQTRHLPQIQFLGFQSQPEIKALYSEADLLFVPSEYETWGLVINEAMCAQTPALVTAACGAAQDLVVPRETGFVFKVGDIAAAVESVKWCIAHPPEFKTMRERAFQRVSENYQPAQFAAKIKEAFLRSGSQIESHGGSRLIARG